MEKKTNLSTGAIGWTAENKDVVLKAGIVRIIETAVHVPTSIECIYITENTNSLV